MITDRDKANIAKLDLEFCPVAVKFSYNPPEGYEHNEKDAPLCAFIKEAQITGKSFYIEAGEKRCMGKAVLGAAAFDEVAMSGVVGFEHGFFRTPACNARLYYEAPTLNRGACNYVTFAPFADCTFDPDLVFFVAPPKEASRIMRASSWYSGDIWESKSSIALSCAWMFAYPYISGKVNFCVTGISYGLVRQKMYPAGLHIITVPYQKLDEVLAGFNEMDWDLLSLLDDEESIAITEKSDAKLAAMHDKTKAFNFERTDSL